MPEKDPSNWALATWALALGMAFVGGVVNFYQRARRRSPYIFNIFEMLGEIFTSAFVGVGVFMLLASFDAPAGICAAGSGVGGHMATRLLLLVEEIVIKKAGRIKDDN